MGRPRNLEHVREIAERVRAGDTYQTIGEELGLSTQVVGKRVKTIRELVTEMGATAITITHDMTTVHSVADEVAMLHGGVIRWQGPVAGMEASGDPYLDQFIHGRAEGPIAAVR